MAETDPEQGANLMVFFIRDWAEIAAVPGLDQLVPGITGQAAAASGGRCRAISPYPVRGRWRDPGPLCLLRMNGALGNLPAADLALTLAVQALLLWSDGAFADGGRS